MKRLILFLITAFIAVSCNDKDDNERVLTMTVASEQIEYAPGEWFDSPYAYLVKIGSSKTWETLYPIVDFDWEDGYEYVIKVSRKMNKPKMEDLASFYYHHIETLSKVEKQSEGLPN